MIVGFLLFSFAFGAADQYLGSLSAHPWATDVSLLAAPWLLLPFAAGYTQRTARGACLLATLCVFVALAGFIAMTLSPTEHAKYSLTGLMGLVGGQARWFVFGAATAPVFGWLGYRWRTDRVLWAPVIAAASLCLEPPARTVIWPIHSPQVRWAEIGSGVVLLGVCASAWAYRRLAAQRR